MNTKLKPYIQLAGESAVGVAKPKKWGGIPCAGSYIEHVARHECIILLLSRGCLKSRLLLYPHSL